MENPTSKDIEINVENIEKLIVTSIKNKYRYNSIKGQCTFEDLWDISLTSNSGFSLDDIAKNINRQIKECDDESFVKKNSGKLKELKASLEIVKYVIKTKLEENEQARLAKEKKEKRQKILQLIEDKQHNALQEKTLEELYAELEETEK
ncbi:MAG: hypothetical protein WC136_01290 [Sphaerochaeta sp.]